MKTFPQYLEAKYLEWQIQEGGRKTLSEFAEYLGIAQNTMSSYLKGRRRPEGEVVQRLAMKLGIELYDVLELSRPDPELFYLQTIWEDLDPVQRRILREQAEKYNARKK